MRMRQNHFTGLAPREALDKISMLCDIAVIKIGSEGSLIKKGKEVVKIGTIPLSALIQPEPAIFIRPDFCTDYAKGLPLEKCGRFGSVLAGHVIEIVGARMDEYRWKKIMEILKEENTLTINLISS